MSRRYQRYAFADERRDEANDKLIDRPFIEEGSDELATAHHPQILSGLSAHLFRERPYWLRYETDTDGDRWRGRPTLEHVVQVICAEVRAHLDTQVECLSTENLRVDRAHEFWQTVKTLRRRPIRQPVDVAVRSSDVTINARRDVNDDFSLPHRRPLLVVSRVFHFVTQSNLFSSMSLIECKWILGEESMAMVTRRRRQRQEARAQQEATYAKRRPVGGAYWKSLPRKRAELVERSFAHCYETGEMRRTHPRGPKNILKRLLIHVGAFNLGLLVRTMLGAGKPREWKNRHVSVSFFVYSMASRGSRLNKHSVFNPTTAGTPKSLLSPISAAAFERTGGSATAC